MRNNAHGGTLSQEAIVVSLWRRFLSKNEDALATSRIESVAIGVEAHIIRADQTENDAIPEANIYCAERQQSRPWFMETRVDCSFSRCRVAALQRALSVSP